LHTLQINPEGQITIPPDIRDQLGLLPGAEVQLDIVDNTLQLRKKAVLSRGEQLVAAIRGKATSLHSTDDIMQLTRDQQ
jgi:AbrB family looped-hinge helix DNA binding protein